MKNSSAYPIEKGSYATISGTSMSSPHVAGAVALLLQAKPNTPSQVVGDILQNSADPKGIYLAPPADLELVHRQGAGRDGHQLPLAGPIDRLHAAARA